MAKVGLKRVRKSFGQTQVLHGVDLEVASGEFMVLVGPSGCGKSTLLRLVAGLEELTDGDITIGDKVVNHVSPKSRDVAMVFQNYALYPHMTVRNNMAFALKLAKTPAADIEARVQDAAQVLGLEALLDRKPAQLSGGQKQRVAMGRAMVRRPSVFLFDEPLSNLDAQLRVHMRSEISLLHRRVKATVIYVTHDQVEAMTLADRIAVMNQGHIEQVGSPLELYHNPKTRFVASFIGTPSMNFVPASSLPGSPGAAASVGFRPEATRLDGSGEIRLGKGKVELVELLGSTAHVHLRLDTRTLVADVNTSQAPRLDEEKEISVNPTDCYFFGGDGRRLGGGGQ